MRTRSLFVHGSYFFSILFFLFVCLSLCNMLLQDFAGKTVSLFDMKVLSFKKNGYTIPARLNIAAIPDTIIDYKLGHRMGTKFIYPPDEYGPWYHHCDSTAEADLRNPSAEKSITVFKWIAEDVRVGKSWETWSGRDEYDLLTNRLAHTTYTASIPELITDVRIKLRGKTAMQNFLLAAPNYILLLMYLFITFQAVKLLGRLRRQLSFMHNLPRGVRLAGLALVMGHCLLWVMQRLNANAFSNIGLWKAQDTEHHCHDLTVNFLPGSYFSLTAVYTGLGLIILSRLLAYGQRLEQNAADLLKVRLEVQEQTLQQVARELHDNIGVRLTRTKLILNTLNWQQPDTGQSNVAGCIDDISIVMDALRSMVRGLDGNYLLANGLVAALRLEVEKTKNTGIDAVLQLQGILPELTDEQELILLRIAQEALNNVLKHAQATQVQVLLAVLPTGGLKLSIADNGKGMAGDVTAGSGLLNMRQRAAFIGGTFTGGSTPGGGYTAEVTIPRL